MEREEGKKKKIGRNSIRSTESKILLRDTNPILGGEKPFQPICRLIFTGLVKEAGTEATIERKKNHGWHRVYTDYWISAQAGGRGMASICDDKSLFRRRRREAGNRALIPAFQSFIRHFKVFRGILGCVRHLSNILSASRDDDIFLTIERIRMEWFLLFFKCPFTIIVKYRIRSKLQVSLFIFISDKSYRRTIYKVNLPVSNWSI